MLVLGISVEGKLGLAVTIHSPGEAFAGKGGEVDLWDTLSDFSTCGIHCGISQKSDTRWTYSASYRKTRLFTKANTKTKIKKLLDTRWRHIVDTK